MACGRVQVVDEETKLLCRRHTIRKTLTMNNVTFNELLQISRMGRLGEIQTCCQETCLI